MPNLRNQICYFEKVLHSSYTELWWRSFALCKMKLEKKGLNESKKRSQESVKNC